jgi:hypothetical protein
MLYSEFSIVLDLAGRWFDNKPQAFSAPKKPSRWTLQSLNELSSNPFPIEFINPRPGLFVSDKTPGRLFQHRQHHQSRPWQDIYRSRSNLAPANDHNVMSGAMALVMVEDVCREEAASRGHF